MNDIIHLRIYQRVVLFSVCILFFSLMSEAQSKQVKVIELRNYILRPGQRNHFIDSFELKLKDTLNARRNHVLGQYTIKDAPDNFMWIRGFEDMTSRAEALTGFYTSRHWMENERIAAQYIVQYTNGYLLKPLQISKKSSDTVSGFNPEWFGKQKGLAVVEFFVANERRSQLIDYFASTYDSILRASGVKDISYWVSESIPNNYPQIPVFQDKNLLVTITFFKDENEYNGVTKKVQEIIRKDPDFRLARIVTTKTAWILFPTKKSFDGSLK